MNDVYLTPQGDYEYPTRYLNGADASVQRARLRTLQHRGEWLLDTRTGAPWIDWLDTKPFPQQQIEEYLRADLLGVPDIASVAVAANFDNTSGQASVTVTLRYTDTPASITLQLAPAAVDPAARVVIL